MAGTGLDKMSNNISYIDYLLGNVYGRPYYLGRVIVYLPNSAVLETITLNERRGNALSLFVLANPSDGSTS
ncbi:hypothetical protein BVI434_2240037 [Burkholderia vietnamiensis]|nr:hypothetical protein BVI434_2240037 [Burkholderia vietnamiensis]